MARILLHNPHAIWYKRTLTNVYLGRAYWKGKYEYIFDELYEDEVYTVITPMFSTFNKYGKHAEKIELLKFYVWRRINGLKKKKFFIRDLADLSKDDKLVVFLYSYFAGDGISQEFFDYNFEKFFERCEAKIVLNFSHYGYNFITASRKLQEVKDQIHVWSENDLTVSELWRRRFSYLGKPSLTIPFVAQNRFKNLVSYENRRNKCLAIGTIANEINDEAFRELFNDGLLQPLRDALDRNKDSLPMIDSSISRISDEKTSTSVKRVLSRFVGLLHLAMKAVLATDRIYWSNYDRGYFDFDMVRTFNEYKLVVNPEEIIGVPGIGSIEAIACGCVLIGQPDYYSAYNLEDGVNFIAYDGTLEDLNTKIEYYLSNTEELEVIQKNSVKNYNENLSNISLKT